MKEKLVILIAYELCTSEDYFREIKKYMDRVRTYWQGSLEIDKMSGLQLHTNQARNPFTICPWDNEVSEVVGTLLQDGNLQWEGVIYSKEAIGKIFKPYQGTSHIPTPYRLRPGNLGNKRKTRGFLRACGIDFNHSHLIVTDSGGVSIKELSDIDLTLLNTLIIETKGKSREIIIPSSKIT